MRRALDIMSGIGMFVLSIETLMAVLKTFFDLQAAHQVPLISIVSLSITTLALFLSFVGAFILLSWARKPS
jgi:hypothetical protein